MAQSSEQLMKLISDQNNRLYGAVNAQRAKYGAPPKQGVDSAAVQDAFNAAYDYLNFVPKSMKAKKSTSGGGSSTGSLSQLEKAAKDLATSKAKAAGIKTKSPGRHWWDDWAENITGAGAGALDKLATAANYTIAPLGRGVEAGLDEFSQKMADITHGQDIKDSTSVYKNKNILDAIMHRVGGAVMGHKKDVISGSEIISKLPSVRGMSGGWQKSLLTQGLGLATDIATDPLTYVTLGTTSLGKEAGLKAAQEGGQALEKGVSGALQKATENTVARSARKWTASEIASRTAQAVAERAALPTVRGAAETAVIKDLAKEGVEVGQNVYARKIEEKLAEQLKPFEDQVRRGLETANKRRLAVKIAGRDVLEGTQIGQKLGRAAYLPAQVAAKGAMALPVVKAAKGAFQMGEHFPGLANRFRRAMEGRGVVHFEKESKKINDMVKGLTHEEERTILRDLESNIRTEGMSKSGKDLGQVWDAFDVKRKENFQKLVDLGIYKPEDYAKSYVPHYYRDGSNEAIQTFKQGRKAGLRSPSGIPVDGTIQAAKDAGLKPLDMVSDAFKHGEADVTRKIGREGYDTMLINEYGVKASEHADELMKQRGMVDVTDKALRSMTPSEQTLFKESGQKIWVHKEMARSMDTFRDFAKMGRNEDLNKFMRFMNKTTNWWKKSATVYNPGNWINNTMGDHMLNYMEGVQSPKWYKESLKLLHEAPNGTVKIGGHEIDRTTLKDLYDRWAAGGFVHPDIPSELSRKTADNLLYQGGQKLNKGITTAYQAREDYSRMAHFLHALDDELSRMPIKKGQKLLGKHADFAGFGKGSFDVMNNRLEKAAAAAGDRVAKWNIDYSGFTPFERKLKKFIPFYSWQRKSVPLMIEAMATKPGRVAAIQRTKSAIDQMLGGKGDQPGTNFPVAIPMWLRDAGFMRVTGGAEPWTIRDPLPTNVMGQTFGGGLSQILLNQVAGLHPGLRIPLEQAFQKEAFTGRQPPGGMEYMLNQMPFSSTLSSLLGTDVRSGAHLNAGERIGQLLGSKPYQVTEARQAGELRRQAQPFKTQVSQINKQLKEMNVAMRTKKNGKVEIYNPETKRVLGTYGNVTDAMTAAIQQAGL